MRSEQSDENSETRSSMRSELSEENSEARSTQSTETIHTKIYKEQVSCITQERSKIGKSKNEAKSVKVRTILELDNNMHRRVILGVNNIG